MQDLTQYSDAELSLMVFNDEGLYRDRNKSWFVDSLKNMFIFTQQQMDELLVDLEDDAE